MAPKTSLCMTTWGQCLANAGGELLSQKGGPTARQSVVGIRRGTKWTKIHVINCHIFSLVAENASMQGEDRGKLRWKSTTSLMGTNVTGRVGRIGPKI
jgi:hypothetical protein